MELGIIGLPQSGKSTLFEIMTGTNSRDAFGETCVRGQAVVPDDRFDHLVSIFHPAKVSPARAPFVDVHAAGEKAWQTVRQSLAGVDGLLHVVDGFTAVDVQEMVQRWRQLEDELILSDLMVVENRGERLRKIPRKALNPLELLQADLLPRLQEQLEGSLPLRELGLAPEELHALRSFSFWTLRPELVVLNTAEGDASQVEAFRQKAGLRDPVIGICGKLEAEMLELPPEEQADFLEALDLTEPAFTRVIRAAFEMLGRIQYFTVGEDEVKSWVIPAESRAPRAAAAIHKDFERGFIKAEVVGYEDFISCGGGLAAAKAAGRLRLEGKDYIVRDGDIVTFRFNV
ncbi:MAG: redox-regulated ATPase YchF [Syntrophaceae bacterium]|nr:redox-regulated ATPase YchF [Syntrophaceae bacterium]